MMCQLKGQQEFLLGQDNDDRKQKRFDVKKSKFSQRLTIVEPRKSRFTTTYLKGQNMTAKSIRSSSQDAGSQDPSQMFNAQIMRFKDFIDAQAKDGVQASSSLQQAHQQSPNLPQNQTMSQLQSLQVSRLDYKRDSSHEQLNLFKHSSSARFVRSSTNNQNDSEHIYQPHAIKTEQSMSKREEFVNARSHVMSHEKIQTLPDTSLDKKNINYHTSTDSLSKDQLAAHQTQKTNLMGQWNVNKQEAALATVNIEKGHTFKNLIHDYMSHEVLVSNQEEATKLSQILHGHQDLTETFLGPSKKVRQLKRRLKNAERQRRDSVERERMQKIQGRLSSQSKSGGSQDSFYSSKSSAKDKQVGSKERPGQILASQQNISPEKRFRPNEQAKWESFSLYHQEMQQKKQERLKTQKTMLQKAQLKSPMRGTRTSSMSVPAADTNYMSKTFGQNMRRSSSKEGAKQLMRTSKAFYLYHQQIQRKRNSIEIERIKAKNAQNSLILDTTESQENNDELYQSSSRLDNELHIIDQIRNDLELKEGDSKQACFLQTQSDESADKMILFIDNQNHDDNSKSTSQRTLKKLDGKNVNETKKTGIPTFDQVSKASPYFVVTNKIGEEKQILAGGPLTKNPLSPLYEELVEQASDYVVETKIPSAVGHFCIDSSRTSTSAQLKKRELMDEIGAMQKYGDLAIANKLSRQGTGALQSNVSKNQELAQQDSKVNQQLSVQSESAEFQLEHRFKHQATLRPSEMQNEKGQYADLKTSSKISDDKEINTLPASLLGTAYDRRSSELKSKNDRSPINNVVEVKIIDDQDQQDGVVSIAKDYEQADKIVTSQSKQEVKAQDKCDKAQAQNFDKSFENQLIEASREKMVETDKNQDLKIMDHFQTDKPYQTQNGNIPKVSSVEQISDTKVQFNEDQILEQMSMNKDFSLPSSPHMHKTMGFKQQSKKATRNNELTNQDDGRDQLSLDTRQKTETKPGVTHDNSAVKRHNSTNDYQEYYAVGNVGKKSLGENSIRTEFLSKFSFHGTMKDKIPDIKISSQEEDSESAVNQPDYLRLTAKQEFKDGLKKQERNMRLVAKVTKHSRADGQTQLKSLNQSNEKILISSQTQPLQKISAFKMPLAQGKGDILPALEKDIQERNPSFQNLSKLFKEKQKQKFYAKNVNLANEILNKVKKKKRNEKIKRTLEHFPKEHQDSEQIVNLDITDQSASDYKENEQDEDGQTNQDFMSYKPTSQERSTFHHSIIAKQGTQSELHMGGYQSQHGKSSFRVDGRMSLGPPVLPSVQERRGSTLTKQQKKLNAVINKNFTENRGSEQKIMIRLTKLQNVPVNQTIQPNQPLNNNNITIVGSNNSTGNLNRFGGSKLFQTQQKYKEQHQSQEQQSLNSIDHRVDSNGTATLNSSRFLTDKPRARINTQAFQQQSNRTLQACMLSQQSHKTSNRVINQTTHNFSKQKQRPGQSNIIHGLTNSNRTRHGQSNKFLAPLPQNHLQSQELNIAEYTNAPLPMPQHLLNFDINHTGGQFSMTSQVLPSGRSDFTSAIDRIRNSSMEENQRRTSSTFGENPTPFTVPQTSYVKPLQIMVQPINIVMKTKTAGQQQQQTFSTDDQYFEPPSDILDSKHSGCETTGRMTTYRSGSNPHIMSLQSKKAFKNKKSIPLSQIPILIVDNNKSMAHHHNKSYRQRIIENKRKQFQSTSMLI